MAALTLRRPLGLLLAALVLLALPLSAAAQVDPTWDHYKVYVSNPVPPPTPTQVRLTDQFGVQDHLVIELHRFMNPTVKVHGPNTFDINRPELHYTWWQISPEPFSETVAVDNQFGSQTLTVAGSEYLLNPAKKNDAAAPIPLANHYKCYNCLGTPVDAPIILTDQFNTFQTVAAFPLFLCNPVEKQVIDPPNVYPILDANQHYVCYVLSPQDPQTFTAIIGDQFLADESIVMSPGELICVPSEKFVATPALRNTWGRLKTLYR